ncbi:MAG: hypothetical protein OHK0039_28200 [Bacteroidia bacterium]
MKTFFLPILLILSLPAFAQISLTGSDLPTAGYRAYLSTPDTLLFVDPAPTGAGYTWDFSQLSPVLQSTDSFVSVNSIPLAIRFLFLSATVAQIQQAPDSLLGISLGDGYQFYRVTSGAYINLGVGGTVSGVPLGLAYDPTDTLFRLPLTYGQQNTSYAQATLDVPGFAFVQQTLNRETEVDGWGSLTTPYGTFDVLRLRSTTTGFDSVAFDTIQFGLPRPRQISYEWWGKEEAVPLLRIGAIGLDTAEVVSGISYVDSLRVFNTTGIRRPAASALALYPNPASDAVQVRWAQHLGQEARLEVFDAQGRQVYETRLTPATRQIPTGHLPAGTYLVRIAQGDNTYQGRLLIQQR